MNRITVYEYFKLLEGVLKEYDIFVKSRCIINMVGYGLQLNINPGEVKALGMWH